MVEKWCTRLRELVHLPPSSREDDAWILSLLLNFIMRVWRHSYELGIMAPGLHIRAFFVELTTAAWLVWLKD